MASFAARAPGLVGAKPTIMLQDLSTARDVPHSVKWINDVGLVPVMARELIARLLVPEFVKVMTRASLVEPTSVPENVTLLGDKVTTGAAAIVTLTVLDVDGPKPWPPE
jgi:hypothetical protein